MFVVPKSPFASMCDSVSGSSRTLNIATVLWFYCVSLSKKDLSVTSEPREFFIPGNVGLGHLENIQFRYVYPSHAKKRPAHSLQIRFGKIFNLFSYFCHLHVSQNTTGTDPKRCHLLQHKTSSFHTLHHPVFFLNRHILTCSSWTKKMADAFMLIFQSPSVYHAFCVDLVIP